MGRTPVVPRRLIGLIQRKGKFVGTVPEKDQGPKIRAILDAGSWWMYSKAGVISCIVTTVFDSSKEFCVQVIIVP